jgi:hypothetical protein
MIFPERLRGYAENRGVLMNAGHRMLRAIDGVNAFRVHFKLGVNFIESLVNRHRIEVYLLDAAGRIAASFERIHWDEQKIVDRRRPQRQSEILHCPLAGLTAASDQPQFLVGLSQRWPPRWARHFGLIY